MARTDDARLGQLYDVASNFEKASGISLYAISIDQLREWLKQNPTYTNPDIVQAWYAIRGDVGQQEQPDPSSYYESQPHPFRPWNIPVSLGGSTSPEQLQRLRLHRDASGWEALLERAAELEKNDPNYKGKKLADIKSLNDFLQWHKHFGSQTKGDGKLEISINTWLRRKAHLANEWQKQIDQYGDKKQKLKKRDYASWRKTPFNIGLESISSREEFLQLRKTNRRLASLPEDFWERTAEIRKAHEEWRKADQWEELLNRFEDKKTNFKQQNETEWRKNLFNIGLGSIRTEAEFIAWAKVQNSKIKNPRFRIPEDAWRTLKPFFFLLNMNDEQLMTWYQTEQAQVAAEKLELSGVPPTPTDHPITERQIYAPPPAAEKNHRDSGEISDDSDATSFITERQLLPEDAVSDEELAGSQAPVLEPIQIPTPMTSMEPIVDDTDDFQQQEEAQQQRQEGSKRPGIRDVRRLAKLLGGGSTTTATASAGGGLVAALAETAPVWGPIVLVLLFIIILLAILIFGDKSGDVIPVTISKTGKEAVANGETMPFGIVVSYPNGAGAVVTDLIPSNAIFDSADGVYDLLDDKDQKVDTTKPDYKQLVRKVRWTNKGSNDKPGIPQIDVNRYKQYGYDFAAYGMKPDDVLPIESLLNVGNDGKQRWEQYAGPAAKQVASQTNVDIGLLGLIAVQESNIDQYAEKCQNNEWDVTKACPDWNSWEVGYGIKPAEMVNSSVDFMTEAMQAVRPDKTNIAQFGRDIINNSKTHNTTNVLKDDPNTEFPDGITLDQIIQGAKNGDVQMRRRLGILMKDELISMYLISKRVQQIMDAASKNNHSFADELQGLNSNLYDKKTAAKVILSVYNNLDFASGGPLQGANNFAIRLKPKENNTYVINKATIVATGINTASGSGSFSGDITKFLPNPVPPDPASATATKDQIIAKFRENQDTLFPLYKFASSQVGLPWQVFAGLHWREADATPNHSMTSGRQIGTPEPDRAAAGDCTGPVGAVDGKADVNCVFASPEDDALFASHFLAATIGKTPSTYEELAQAFSRYNGAGNVNCGRTPYPNCPPAFEGDDSPYALNMFDDKHAVMYQRYCADGQLCSDGTVDHRPGALTVTKWVAGSFQ